MKESNHQKYISLLGACIENAKGLSVSATLLLGSELDKDVKSDSSHIKKQDQAIHAQHFLYLCLEEIGKFFLILKQYPKELDTLNLDRLGFYNHNSKIEALILFVKKIQSENNKPSPYPVKGVVEIFRNFKEPNVYVDYKEAVIIKPIAKKGANVLVDFCKTVTSSLALANVTLNDFKNNSNLYA